MDYNILREIRDENAIPLSRCDRITHAQHGNTMVLRGAMHSSDVIYRQATTV